MVHTIRNYNAQFLFMTKFVMYEESKDSKESGYNKKHWWEGGPISYETLEEKAEHWTLGADAATATLLQQISSKMIARTHEVEAALKNVCEDVDDLHVSLSNVATSLHLLSNMQFTENRTYQEDESTRVDSASTNIKAEKCGLRTQEDLMSSCCQAIAEGLDLVKNSYMKMEISDSESEGGEEGQKKGMLTVYQRINPYENHKLPHLIGSSNFYTDDTLGLIDVDEEEEEERQINDEKWSTTSSVCSGDGKKDNHLLPSLPIVANSSKMEDEDSDSDGSFILSSKEMSKREVKNLEQYPSAEQVSVSSDHSNKKVNATPSSSLLQPNSNGVLLDSDEDCGPIFEPPKDSYITRPLPRQHTDSEPLFKSDLKNPELSHTNIEKERLFRGIQEPNREGSKLFDLSDSDEDGLFSSKMDPKTSGTSKSTYEKPKIETTPEGDIESDAENEETKEDTTNHGLKDDKTLRHQNLIYKEEQGINIFNAAITKAIEKQHLSGSNREDSTQSNGSKNGSNEKASKTGSVSSEKEEERGLFMPKPNANSHIIKNTSSKVTSVSSNNSKKKSLSTSLFSEDDDDDLFRPPRPHVSKSVQSTVLPGSPVLSKTKSLDSNASTSVKSKMDQRATTLDSIFGDSDDDLFTSVKKAQSTRATSVVASNYQTEPPPLPQSSYSSSLSDKKGSITKKVKSKVGIFSSSSSDDDIFTPRKPREKYLGVNKPGIESSFNPPRQEPSNPPHTVDVENPYLRSADLVTNPEDSNIPTLDKSSNTSSASSSKLPTKGNESIPPNHPSVMSKKSPKKSLFGSSDDDDDDIFTPKSMKINEKNKVLPSSHSDEPSSSNVLKKPDSSKKVIDNTALGKTIMNGSKELPLKKDMNPITLADNRNIESDSSEDDIFKFSREKISKPKETLTKFGKTEQSESDTLQFGSTVSDSSILTGQRTSSQNDILSKQNKSTLSDANDIFNDSSDVDIFSDFKSESSTRHGIKSDKPTTHIDSSDDNLFSNKNPKIKTESESNKVQILSEKLGSDDLFSSNKEKDDENLPKNKSSNEFTKTKDFDSSNVKGINNNNTKNSLQKKNKPGKNLFSSDSDEDIFSTIKTNIHRKGTKDLKIFSDSDDNDDIFSKNFKSKHKLGDNVEKNFGGQIPKLEKTELPKSADTKEEILHSHIKPAKMPKPVVSEPIANKKEKPSAIGGNEITKSHSMDQPKVNLSTDNSTEVAHKSSLTKSIFDDDDDDDLFTSPKSSKSPTVTEEKALKSSTEKSRQVEKDLTDGITSSLPKQSLPKIGKENYAKDFKSEHASEKKSVEGVPHFPEKDKAGEASLFKEDNLSQSLSHTRNMSGGLPLVKDDGPSLLSPTKKKPVGGVALFGGEELLSKLKSRRKSLSSESENNDDDEDISSKDKSSNITGFLSLRNKSVEDKANKISPNQITSPKIRNDTLVSGSITNQNLTPSISVEGSVSFDSEQRASDLLVSLNKGRPKIQHERKLPSRLKKNVKKALKNSDIIDYAVDVPESSINKDKTHLKEAPDSLSSRNKESSEICGNEGKISTVSSNNLLLESNKNITVENNSKFICEKDDFLDSKSKPVPKQENLHQNTENSFKISENKKSTENEFLSSKNKNSSSSIDASRKIEPPLGLEGQGKKHLNVDDIFNDGESEKKEISVKKMSKHSTNIFGDDDEDIDSLFNASTNKKSNKSTESVKTEAKLSKRPVEIRKALKPSSSIFSDDDDEDDDSLFSSTSSSLKKVIAPPKVKTGKTTTKQLSIFSDDDSESELFSGATSESVSKQLPPKTDSYHKKRDEKQTQKSFPTKSTLSKERTFVDPLMGDQS
ncbi:WASH complex subunit FAM21 [Armadillidium vulgare]|nr:WASH complex subunit FAM21 [Armadillidium vulgare]